MALHTLRPVSTFAAEWTAFGAATLHAAVLADDAAAAVTNEAGKVALFVFDAPPVMPAVVSWTVHFRVSGDGLARMRGGGVLNLAGVETDAFVPSEEGGLHAQTLTDDGNGGPLSPALFDPSAFKFGFVSLDASAVDPLAVDEFWIVLDDGEADSDEPPINSQTQTIHDSEPVQTIAAGERAPTIADPLDMPTSIRSEGTVDIPDSGEIAPPLVDRGEGGL